MSHFTIELAGSVATFAEVTGLADSRTITALLRATRPARSSPRNVALGAGSMITLKRGVLAAGSPVHEWLVAASRGATSRDLVITLHDAAARPVVRWRVRGAIPVKIVAPTLNASGNDVAIESIELTSEGIAQDEA